jgi:hypothetical protein
MARRPNVDLVTLAQNHGGFSVKEASGRHGGPGTYASRGGSETMVTGTLTANTVREFRRQHAAELESPGAYLGGYREPGPAVRQKSPQRPGDETYLDVSKRFIGEGRLPRAIDFARREGQISVYDSDQGVVYAHQNPAVPEDRAYPYASAMAAGARAQRSARAMPRGPERTRRVEEMVDAIELAQRQKR